MDEDISSELSEKINKNVEKVFDKWIEKASKGESIEGIVKSLMVEKIMNILGAFIKRTAVKKIVKRRVKKRVDKFFEKNKDMIMEKIKLL